MAKVTLLTGGNIGDINNNINKVCDLISERLGDIVFKTSVHKSEAWGFESDDFFLNQVIVIETELLPDDLLFEIWEIERLFGRIRMSRSQELDKWRNRHENGVKNYASRAMDIDILYYDDKSIVTDYLVIPHPEINNREFVKNLLSELE